MPTVLVTTSTFPRWEGDTVPARFVFDLSLQLKRDYHVIVLAPHAPGAAYRETLEDLEVWRFPYFWPHRLEALCNGGGILPALRSGWLPKCQAPFLFMAELYGLIALLRSRKIDLINSHWMIPQGFTVALAKKGFPRIPHLLTIHSSDVHTLRRLPGGRTASRFILKSADHVITVSRFLHQKLRDLTGRDVDARVLPMGVNTATFVRHDDRRELRQQHDITAGSVVLYVGKLIEVKGVSTLLKAMPLLRQVSDVQLLIAGSGVLRSELERDVRDMSLTEHVRFYGTLDHDRLSELYRLCDVVVVPSIITTRQETEGMPVVILEAMAAGCPVVASDVGGISDVVDHGRNGFLVPSEDAGALADALLRVFDPTAASAMRAHALETAQSYDWQRIGDAYNQTIHELIHAHPSAQRASNEHDV